MIDRPSFPQAPPEAGSAERPAYQPVLDAAADSLRVAGADRASIGGESGETVKPRRNAHGVLPSSLSLFTLKVAVASSVAALTALQPDGDSAVP